MCASERRLGQFGCDNYGEGKAVSDVLWSLVMDQQNIQEMA